MDTSVSGFTAGPSSGSRHLMQVRETETLLESNLLQVSLRRGVVLILALSSSPYQQILPFFQTCWLRNSLENWGRRRRGREKTARGEKQPQGWREILYACALKHKVCGQLLKDFSGESRLSTESIEWGREGESCLLMPVQLNSAGVTERHCQLWFFFSLLFSDLANKKCNSTFTPTIHTKDLWARWLTQASNDLFKWILNPTQHNLDKTPHNCLTDFTF